MDLNQRKLNKSEWDSIEIPASQTEKDVYSLIINGYEDINIRNNNNKSLLGYLKVEISGDMDLYLYNKYFDKKCQQILETYSDYGITLNSQKKKKINIKKIDKMRLEQNDSNKLPENNIYEYILLTYFEKVIKYRHKNKKIWQDEYYTLYKLSQNKIKDVNQTLMNIIHQLLESLRNEIDMNYLIYNCVEIIEKNKTLLKYGDLTLYEHQKNIFHNMRNPNSAILDQLFHGLPESPDDYMEEEETFPKLILYIAPTGTGKTLTPLGLSGGYKIIFICAARHVGLALAKASISAGKKIAFAFGCSEEEDIRLHYFAAKEYSVNRRSGGIWKVDNSVGDKVEIMICDVKSYLCAMNYMMRFNHVNNLLVYWDEPTISLDYEEHDLHKNIHDNWKYNKVPHIVLSSATLPKEYELEDTITDFQRKFPHGEVINIVSHDCKKSIPILDKSGYAVLPHHLSRDYDDILKIVEHCEDNLTLLRYFDLIEIVCFLKIVEEQRYTSPINLIKNRFTSIDDVTMQNIKLHYLRVLKKVTTGTWGALHVTTNVLRTKRLTSNNEKNNNSLSRMSSIGPGYTPSNSIFTPNMGKGGPLTKTVSEPIPQSNKKEAENSGIYISTKDAHTLTDGPTIYLSHDVEKVAKFCIQQSNIPAKAMDDIMEKIEYNNKLTNQLEEWEMKLETLENKNSKKEDTASEKGKKEEKKKDNSQSKDPAIIKLTNEINTMRNMIKIAELNETFVPNKPLHKQKWASDNTAEESFTSDIEPDVVSKIMLLSDVENSWKILLMMGIGVFTSHISITYTEIMKRLADEQKLYLIIASSDYIYGTNYQFCHGYLSKNMEMTQEKIIQSLGRIGRNNIQQTYSIRIRDDNQIKQIFYKEENKKEVVNMNRLFNR